ncbi:MAG: PDZ domain-containing protein [Planctomycetaceae bacterium]|nr:PDZ domain-containing protein [Planctomycetaceae bacterium]
MTIRFFMLFTTVCSLLLGTLSVPTAQAQFQPVPNPPRGIQIVPRQGGFGNSPFENRGRPQQKLYVPVLPAPPPLPSRIALSDERLKKLTQQLESGNYRERVEATRILKQEGSLKTVQKMTAAAKSNSPELSMRALSVLEAIFLSADDVANRAAETGLEDLAFQFANDLGMQAREILTTHAQLRSKRATGDLQAKGLYIEFRTDMMPVDEVTGELYPGIGHVRLGKGWKGGEEGIRDIQRLQGLNLLYVISNCPVSAKRVEEILNPIAPEIRIEERGAVELGVRFLSFSNTPQGKGVLIGEVTPGKSAHAAGLRANDVILSLDGEQVDTFNKLVDLLKKYEPGDVIKIERARTSNLEESDILDVKLKGW